MVIIINVCGLQYFEQTFVYLCPSLSHLGKGQDTYTLYASPTYGGTQIPPRLRSFFACMFMVILNYEFLIQVRTLHIIEI